MNSGRVIANLSKVRVPLTIALLAVVFGSLTTAQEKPRRRGAPRDWSHNRIVATRFGPDADVNVNRHLRTRLKHAQLERMKEMRERRRPIIDWFETFTKKAARRQAPEPPESSDTKLDWSLRTGGFGSVVAHPAKYNFDITAANCSDVIYYTVNQTGAAATPNLIAITNPYFGCPGNPANLTPTVKFGIRMQYGSALAPVPSLDGEVVYVIEQRSSANGGMILHAVLVDNITSSPGTYDYGTTNWSNAHTLASPTGLPTSEQLFSITVAGVTDSLSSPFLDYDNNQIFFGDSTGYVRRVSNAHLSTASLDTTNWPVRCGTSALQSPVFVNGQVIVASTNGRLYRIDTNVAPPYTCVASGLAGEGTGAGQAGGLTSPLIDVSNNKVIVVTNDANGSAQRSLNLFNLTFGSNEAPVSTAFLGPASTTNPVIPALDDAFWSTNNGNVYAIGTPAAGNDTYMMRVPYNGSTLGSVAGRARLTRSSGAPGAVVATSPITEFLTASSSGSPDFLFVGGAATNYRFVNRISAGFAGTDGSPVSFDGSFAVPGGAQSHMAIDTRTTLMTGTTATANIYFGTVGISGTTQSTIVQLAQQF